MERIADIIESIANEKNLPVDAVAARVAVALTNTAKRIYGEKYEFFVNEKTLKLYQKIVVLNDDDIRISAENEHYMALSKAKLEAGDVEVGDELTYEIELEKLGRTAVNILQKELEYNIQKLLEESVMNKYKGMEHQMVFGNVVRVDEDENTYIEIGEIRAVLPRKNRIKGEKFKNGNVVKAVIRRVFADRSGIRMELSRTSPKFLEALLKAEVPEIKDGTISILNAARIPGERAKIILKANAANVDAVGSTVGQKGVRINAVSKELHGENIDCIEHCDDVAILITRALAPAMISSVKIVDVAENADLAENDLANDEMSESDTEKPVIFRDKKDSKPTKKAIVTLNAEQKSKAIGKNGINIRLAAMLTGLEIELRELGGKIISEAIKDAMKDAANKPLNPLDALEVSSGANPLDSLKALDTANAANPLDNIKPLTSTNPLDALNSNASDASTKDESQKTAKDKAKDKENKDKNKDEAGNEEAMKNLQSLFKD